MDTDRRVEAAKTKTQFQGSGDLVGYGLLTDPVKGQINGGLKVSGGMQTGGTETMARDRLGGIEYLRIAT
jgi:hypothetical protein